MRARKAARVSATAVGEVAAGGAVLAGEAGLLRMQQSGVIVSDYATLIVEALADNADPAADAVYAALDMPFAVLVGQISAAHQHRA
jgi:hypothetical protein